jgi:diguanylate cyclase (GGDEF)-like protein
VRSELAERVRLHVSATPVRIVREAVPVTVSVGVAHMTAPPDDAARVLYRAADEALYAAKRGGRDRIEVVDEVSASAIVAAPRTPGWAVR